MDMTGVHACLCEAVCGVTTVPSHLDSGFIAAGCHGYNTSQRGDLAELAPTSNDQCLALLKSSVAGSPVGHTQHHGNEAKRPKPVHG